MIVPALQTTPYALLHDQGEAVVEKEILLPPSDQEQSHVPIVMGGEAGRDQ